MNCQKAHFLDAEWGGKMKLQNSVVLDCRFMENLLAEDRRLDSALFNVIFLQKLIAKDNLNRMERKKTVEKINHSLQRKKERGEPLGRPPFGLKYSEDKTSLAPGKRFEDALKAIKLRKEGLSFHKIEQEANIASSTVKRVVDHKDRYMTLNQDRKSG